MGAEDSTQLSRVCESYARYLALGNRTELRPAANFVSNPGLPRLWDANHLSCVRAAHDAEIRALLEAASAHFAALDHEYFILDPLTPQAFEARLVQRGLNSSAELELLLEGPLAPVSAVAGLEIRLAESDADWETIGVLSRKEEVEEADKFQREALRPDITQGLVASRRDKSPEVRTWLARSAGVDCAHLSSWPGQNGVGKVEDLFTLPAYRHRGIASALIAHCVADARERGAQEVLIGAMPADTPRLMYEALGFRPYCVMRGYQSSTTRSAPSNAGE
jgi:GNAT superfamily N-acetyltransferase